MWHEQKTKRKINDISRMASLKSDESHKKRLKSKDFDACQGRCGVEASSLNKFFIEEIYEWASCLYNASITTDLSISPDDISHISQKQKNNLISYTGTKDDEKNLKLT